MEQFTARSKESDLAKEAINPKPKNNYRTHGRGRGQFGSFRGGGGWQHQQGYSQKFQQQQ
ncbi:hypothetical protein BGZ46_001324, partial [Entomortierella lignicola]